MSGKYFEELEIGAVFEHQPGRTVTETDNLLFTTMTIHAAGWIIYFCLASSLMMALVGMITGLWAEKFDNLATITNFVMARLGPGARDLAEAVMWEDGIVVRAFPPGYTLEFYLRFTVRSPAENERLLSTLSRRLT